MIFEAPPQVFSESYIENIALKRCEHLTPGFLGDEAASVATEVLAVLWRGVQKFNLHNSISADMDGLWSALTISWAK